MSDLNNNNNFQNWNFNEQFIYNQIKKIKDNKNYNKGLSYIEKWHTPNNEINENTTCKIEQYSESIDNNETNIIKNIVQIFFSNFGRKREDKTLSHSITKEIKKKLGGEWFVFVSNKNDNIHFNISSISNSDYLIIVINQSRFKIAKMN